MKKLLFAAILSFSVIALRPSWAASPYSAVIQCYNAAGGAACSTPDFCDLLDEGFIGEGFEAAGWTEDDGDGDMDPDFDCSGYTTNEPNTSEFRPCDEGLRCDITDGGDGLSETWSEFNSASAYSDWTIYFTFYVDDMGAGDTVDIFATSETTSPSSVCYLHLYETTGTFKMRVRGSGGNTDYVEGFALDSWHTVKIDFNKNAESTVWFNGESGGTFTAADVDIDYWLFGCPMDMDANDDIDVTFGDVHIENDSS